MRALLLLLLAAAASGEETAAFLKLGAGARALGMSGAFTAAADDATALYWNPAGLARMARREMSATHAQLPLGARYDFVAYAHPTARGTFSGSAAHLSQGALDGRDDQGAATDGFSASDAAATFGYAAALGGPLRLGGAVKLLRSSIAEQSAQGFALDAGGQYALGATTLGLAVQNAGPGLKLGARAGELPLTVAAGAAYRLPAGFMLAVDAKTRPRTGKTEFSVGTEYSLIPSFSLRGGYSRAAGAQSLPTGRGGSITIGGLAAGFGLKARHYSLDYALTPLGELGNVQRVTLGARF